VRAILQRVSRASVRVEGEVVGEIGPGLLILACAMQGDDGARAEAMAAKIARLRIFRDEQGRMNRSLLDTGGAALVVSQFTLAADLRGNRPGFSTAAPPEEGRALVDRLTAALAAQGITTATGRFGAEMEMSLVNDGPVTIWVEL
jgi:D-tyrosyl-tRNA(Tyr) deacylase